MHRRDLIAAFATAAVGGTATLGTATVERSRRREMMAPEASPTSLGKPSLPVPESELSRAAPRDAIPAIVNPAYADDWNGVEAGSMPAPTLSGADEVLGIARDGRARAYPLKLLDRHEIVNDEFGGPLLVTYCPVCRSGLAANREVDGTVRSFGVSGHLYRANLVLYDQGTESLWSQLLATAIRGPLTGTELSPVPITTTTWREWQRSHPNTKVLLPPPASETVLGDVRFNYDLDIYGRHRTIAERYPDHGPLGDVEWSDTRLRRRTLVVGVSTADTAKAYPLREVRWNEPINDVVGDLPVVVALGPEETLVAYDRRVDGQRLQFSAASETELAAGGSRWRKLTGEATSGPHEGTTLRSATAAGGLYWAAWLNFHPETTVYGRE